MSNKVTDNLIDDLVNRNEIIDIVSQYIQLKKTGRNFKALCPFHNEKTPSFVVSEDKQLYHCFGCGAAGNVINFIMDIENLDFIDAVGFLSERFGIDVSQYDSNHDKEKTNKKNEMIIINREAAIYFYKNLWKTQNNALEYLKLRGLNKEVIKKFGLGYAIDEWEGLNKYLLNKGFSQELIFEAGLVIKRKDEKGYYDRFRNRIIFPIFNTTKKIVGFGGRVLDESLPKYLNSPESIIFSKSNILYGLNFARNELGSEKKLIVVEGYTDVISLYQYGIKNGVATLGTALTQKHGELFKRYCDEVFIAYDSDSAGEAATLRGLEILGDIGCKVKVIRLDEGMDPDGFIRKEGLKEFENIISKALPLIDYKIELIKNENDITSNEGKINFIKNTIKVLKDIKSPVQLDVYVSKISQDTGVPSNVIKAEINGNNRDKKYIPAMNSKKNNKFNYNEQQKRQSLKPVKKIEKNGPLEIEKNIISLSLTSNNIYNKVIKVINYDDFINDDLKEIFALINEAYKQGHTVDKNYLIDNLSIEVSELLQDILHKPTPYENIDKIINELAVALKKHKKNNKITIIKNEIKELETKEIKDERDVKKIKQLCGEMIELEKQFIQINQVEERGGKSSE